MVRRLLWGTVCALLMSSGLGGVAGADAPSPDGVGARHRRRRDPDRVQRATGRPPGGPRVLRSRLGGLHAVGVLPRRHGRARTRRRRDRRSPATAAGRSKPTSEAPYTTRVVVNRPVDRRDFNGTVVVEWLNVSGGADASPDWMHDPRRADPPRLRLGRRVGAGRRASTACKGVPPQGDPVRYALARRTPATATRTTCSRRPGRRSATTPTCCSAGCGPSRLIAVGESQSAGRLVTYIDAVHPLVERLRRLPRAQPQRRGRAAVAGAAAGGADARRRRSSATTSTFRCWSSRPRPTPAVRAGPPARHARTYRLWEVAGTAHFDQYGLLHGRDRHRTPRRRSPRGSTRCCTRPTSRTRASPARRRSTPGPQTFVLRAAIAHLNRWVARRHAAARGATPGDGQHRAGRVRPRRQRQRARRHPHPGRGRAGRHAQRPRPDRDAVLLPVRHHDAVHARPARRALYGSHGGFVSAWNRATGQCRPGRLPAARRRPPPPGRRRAVRHPAVAGPCGLGRAGRSRPGDDVSPCARVSGRRVRVTESRRAGAPRRRSRCRARSGPADRRAW